MALNLQNKLQELTALPATEHPLLSIYLDWRPDGNGQRKETLQTLQQNLDVFADRYNSGEVRAHFMADQERIMDYVNNQAPVDAAGLAIFACDATGLWETLPLQVSVPTQVIVDRFPHTFNLAHILDDYETYAVVLADSQESRILVVSLNQAEQAAHTEAAEEIRRFEAGGWAQMLFQRRTDNIIKAHTKDIAQALARVIRRRGVKHVIIASNDSIKGIVLNTLPDQIKAILVDYINLDINANLQSIMETLEPMMRDVERRQEEDVLADLEEQVGQNFGVVGTADTAMALTKGQVLTLVMHQGFVGTGGECPNCGALRPGLRDKCPFDGAELQQVDLREVFTARAVQQAAEIQVVEASEYLDKHEGVGAILRYREQAQSRTA